MLEFNKKLLKYQKKLNETIDFKKQNYYSNKILYYSKMIGGNNDDNEIKQYLTKNPIPLTSTQPKLKLPTPIKSNEYKFIINENSISTLGYGVMKEKELLQLVNFERPLGKNDIIFKI